MTDGGEVVQPAGGRDVQQRRLLANEIACQLVAIDGVQEFDTLCAIVENIQKAIIRAWTNEERQQAERVMGLAEVAVKRNLEQQAMRACERWVDPRPTRQS